MGPKGSWKCLELRLFWYVAASLSIPANNVAGKGDICLNEKPRPKCEMVNGARGYTAA